MGSSNRRGWNAVFALWMGLLVLLVACGYDGTGPYGGGGGGGGYGGGGGGGGVTSGHTLAIAMQGETFNVRLDTVTVGSTVTWTNQDGEEHTTTSDTGLWESGTMQAGATYQHEFTQAGQYPYHCRFHGGAGGIGMSGTIVVVQ